MNNSVRKEEEMEQSSGPEHQIQRGQVREKNKGNNRIVTYKFILYANSYSWNPNMYSLIMTHIINVEFQNSSFPQSSH